MDANAATAIAINFVEKSSNWALRSGRYNCLEQRGYRHFNVNHSKNLKDPVTGAVVELHRSSDCQGSCRQGL